jgi:hypothetical protein
MFYARGDHVNFELPCPSIPLDVNLESLKARLATPTRQEMRPGFEKKVAELIESINIIV